MIYPTRGAVWAMAAGAPFALAVAVASPRLWYAGLAWPLAVLVLVIADLVLGMGRGEAKVTLPPTAGVGEDVAATVAVRLTRQPATADVAVATDGLLVAEDDGRIRMALTNGEGAAKLPLATARRGTGAIVALWLRWRGPLGLVWHQVKADVSAEIAILPDIRAVSEKGARIFERHAMEGLLQQVDRGDGTDFDALVEFRAGMDRRAIDWKTSARHQKLYAAEYKTERNNQIVFAVDCGRQMTEPVAGLARIDRAISAMLLTGWVALKLGDRVALHAFDSRPRIASGFVSGARGFPALQRVAARIDYSSDESNYTFALTSLATELTRRSMIVLFTEFTDQTSSDFMVRAAARLVERHLLMVVVLRDEELEAIIDKRPETADDVTRAVTAAGLLADRRLAITRLRHLGVHVIEAAHDQVTDALVNGYIDLKRRNLL